MSDTVVNDPSNANLVEEDQPRIGAPHPMLNQAPQGSVFDTAPTAAALPVVSPVLTDGSNPVIQSPPGVAAAIATAPASEAPSLPTLPTLPAPGLPTAGAAPVLPAPNAAVLAIPPSLVDAVIEGEPDPRKHPMAHLMPEKMKPTEASLRAAEARAAKKAKARKIKIVVWVCILAFSAVVGPPLGKWLVNAINEAGSTKPDEPPATVAPTTVAPTTVAPVAPTTVAPAASLAPEVVVPPTVAPITIPPVVGALSSIAP